MSTIVGPIQKKRGTAAALAAANPVLLAGEEAYELDTGLQKRGDGATAWTALGYLTGSGAGVTAVVGLAGTVLAGPLTAAQVAGLPAGVLTGTAATVLFPVTVAGVAYAVSLAQLIAAVGGVSPPVVPPPPTTASMNFTLASNSQYIGAIL